MAQTTNVLWSKQRSYRPDEIRGLGKYSRQTLALLRFLPPPPTLMYIRCFLAL